MNKLVDITERFLNLLLVKGFCPTGQGGGVDNSCGVGGGGGGGSGGGGGGSGGGGGGGTSDDRVIAEARAELARLRRKPKDDGGDSQVIAEARAELKAAKRQAAEKKGLVKGKKLTANGVKHLQERAKKSGKSDHYINVILPKILKGSGLIKSTAVDIKWLLEEIDELGLDLDIK